MLADAIIFLLFMLTLKKILFFLYVLKTHLDCFNSQVNNLDDMEREPLFYRHKAIYYREMQKVGY